MRHTSKRRDRKRPHGKLTLLLSDMNNRESLNAAIQMVYEDLHRMAARYFRGERRNHTLQPTALVHEAVLRLMEKGGPYPNGRYFFGAASRAMRRILIESARRSLTHKRGGGWVRADLNEVELLDPGTANDLIDFDSALTRLESVDPRLTKVVELRTFCGFTAQETGQILGMGESTVRGKWSMATQWLRQELGEASDEPRVAHKKVHVAKTTQ